jgi:TRAP-type mannitol/chloroaromatic compound transport system substrate-binding protein
MDRREFIQAGVAGAALAGVAPAAAEATNHVAAPAMLPTTPSVLRGAREIVLALPQAYDDVRTGAVAHVLGKEIEAAFPGRWRVALRRISTTGLEAVTAGDADLYLSCETQHATFHPAFVAFAGLTTGEHLSPFLHTAWLTVGGGQDLWDDLAAGFGVKAYQIGHSGISSGLAMRDLAIAQSVDFSELTIASRGLGLHIVAALGGRPLQLDDVELPAAFSQRAIDAAEPFLDAQILPAGGWMSPGFHAGGMALSLGLRASFWSSLGRDEQTMVSGIAAMQTAQALSEGAVRAAVERAARGTGGSQSERRPAARLEAAMRGASADAVSSLAGHDATARRIVDSYRAFRRLVTDAAGPQAET